MGVQTGLCRTWSETPKTGFLTTRLKLSCNENWRMHLTSKPLPSGNERWRLDQRWCQMFCPNIIAKGNIHLFKKISYITCMPLYCDGNTTPIKSFNLFFICHYAGLNSPSLQTKKNSYPIHLEITYCRDSATLVQSRADILYNKTGHFIRLSRPSDPHAHFY